MTVIDLTRTYTAEVPLVWAINLGNQTVEVYHIGQLEPQTLTLNYTLDGEEIIPGLSLPIRKLFEEEEVG